MAAMDAHIDVKNAIIRIFNEQTDDQFDGVDPDTGGLDFTDVKLTHNGYAHNVQLWTDSRNQNLTTPSRNGETEVYFRAETNMTQSFRMPTTHENMEAKVEIPQQYRLNLRDPNGGITGFPEHIVVPHIGEGRFDKTSVCPNSRPDGTRIQFEEIHARGDIIINTHFKGAIKIKRGFQAMETIPMEELMADLDLLEVNEQIKSSKFYVSRGLINIMVKREVCKKD